MSPHKCLNEYLNRYGSIELFEVHAAHNKNDYAEQNGTTNCMQEKNAHIIDNIGNFTPQELNIIPLMSLNFSIKEIAAILELAAEEAREHIMRINQKIYNIKQNTESTVNKVVK